MNLNPVILAIPLFLTLIIVELAYEALTRKSSYRLNDAITNINLGGLDQVSGLFLKLLKIGIYTILFEQFALYHIPQNGWSFIVLFILFDLCYYWSHRMAHEVSLFWGGHVVHHQSEDYNLSVALRQSSTAIVWSVPFYLPLALMGFDPVQFVFVNGLNLIYQFWIHTEHIDRLPKWFEAVMNTPSHHRVHHGRDPKYIDKNYAGVFILWDKIFGTFKAEEERPHYGITKPLNSWNPIYANVAHYIDLFALIKRSKGPRDTLKILFNKPGWQPDYLGGYIAPKEVAKDDVKYNASVNLTGFKAYIFVQLVVTLGVTAYFLLNNGKFSLGDKGIFAAWFFLTSFMFAVYFESKNKWFIFLEGIRLLGLPLGLFILMQGALVLPSFVLLIVLVYAILSWGAFIWLMQKDAWGTKLQIKESRS